MKKFYNIGERFLALLLAVIMVVGLLPMSVAAEDTEPGTEPGTTVLTLMSAQLEAVEITEPAPEEPEEPTEEPEVNPENPEVDPENPEVDPENPEVDPEEPTDSTETTPAPKKFSYTLTVWGYDADDGELKDITGTALCTTVAKVSGITMTDCETFVLNESAVLTVEVQYKGMTINLSATGGVGAEDTVEVAYANPIIATRGAEFDASKYVPVKVKNDNTSIGDAQWSYTLDASVFAENNVLTGSGENAVTYTLDGIATVTMNVEAVNPDYSVEAKVSGDQSLDAWYTPGKNVTVTLDVGDLEIADTSYLPKLMVGEAENGSWTQDTADPTKYTITVENVMETTTFAVSEGDFSWSDTINIDPVPVSVTNLSAAVENGGTEIRFGYTLGESGVKSAVLSGTKADGTAYTLDMLNSDLITFDKSEIGDDGSVGTVQKSFTIAGVVLQGSVQVEIKNNADSTGSANGDTTDGLAIGEPQVSPIGSDGTSTYLANGSVITFQVSNTIDEIDIVATVKNGDVEIPCEIDQANDTVSFTLSAEEGTVAEFAALSVEVSNGDNRTASKDDIPAYVIDRKAPEISVDKTSADAEPNTVGDVDYYSETVTYAVSVVDRYFNVEDVEVKYTLDGVDGEVFAALNPETNQYEFTVANGDKLTGISIDATDLSGNFTSKVVGGSEVGNFNADGAFTGNDVVVDTVNPEVSLTVSDNVKEIRIINGKLYAIVDPVDAGNDKVYEDTGSRTVDLTVTVKDTNFMVPEGKEEKWNYDDDNDEWTCIYSVTVDDHETAKIDAEFTVVDLAGRSPDKNIKHHFNLSAQTSGTLLSTESVTCTEGGVFDIELNVDTRAPGSAGEDLNAAPVIEFVIPDTGMMSAGSNAVPLYNVQKGGTVEFNLNIVDSSNGGSDSGIKEVTVTMNNVDENAFLIPLGTKKDNGSYTIKANNDDSYTAGVKVNGTGESNNVVLTMKVTDNAGNTYTYILPTFAVDNKASAVTVKYNNINGDIANGKFLNKTRTATISVDDINFDPNMINVLVNDEAYNGTWNLTNKTIVVEFNVDGAYTFEVNGKDTADNQAVVSYLDGAGNAAVAPNEFIIDTVAPEIVLTKTGTVIQSSGNTDYYNQEASYQFTFSDENMTYGKGEAYIQYKLEGDETFKGNTKVLIEGFEIKKYVTNAIRLTDGDVLTDLIVYAKDNAGNVTTQILITGYDENGNNVTNPSDEFVPDKDTGILSRQGKKIAVDMSDPVVTLTKTVENGKKFVQEFEDHDYYNGEVTYTITVKDQFLNQLENSKAQAVVTFDDGGQRVINLFDPEAANEDRLESEWEERTQSFTVENGKCVTDITIHVVDNAGRAAKKIEVTDKDSRTTFDYDRETKIHTYSGRNVVVDTVKPEAVLTVSGNVNSFYIHDGVAYVKMNTANVGSSGVASTLGDEQVTLTIDVTDKNLTLDESNEFAVKTNIANDVGAWSGDTPKNGNSTVTYEKKITVPADATGYFEIDLNVFDLAGNDLITDDITVQHINNTTIDFNNLKNAVIDAKVKGHMVTTISVDRRRPASVVGDNVAPQIVVTPSAGFATVNGMELYSGAFNYSVNITDGNDEKTAAGLKIVEWNLSDSKLDDYVQTVAQDQNFAEQNRYETSYGFNVPVSLNGSNETDSVKLTISAEDNVGNITTYEKTFGVDNLAPRVNVDYNNDSVLNEKYFKNDRVATITVNELYFDASLVPITTEVGAAGWSTNGNIHTTTRSYTTDGNYTFDMSAKDLAGNVAEIKFADGTTAPKAFTIDKTAPVISVSYDQSVVDTDPQGVEYYDEDLGVTVTIREVNFSAGDVVADFGEKNALDGWTVSGYDHVASEVFTEGNNYDFSVAYTDLAGNPATTYTSNNFSVDKGDPKIEISKGTLTTDGLNTVQGDLLLGFTITDAESNLKDFNVQVTHVNNEFKTTTINGNEYFTVNKGDRTTGTIDFTAIARDKGNDGIYTIRVTAVDFAGHEVSLSPEMVISLNRFGSTFMTEDAYTVRFLTPSADGGVYQSLVEDKLVIKEINPNRVWQDADMTVEGSVVTVSVNGTSTVLVKDEDYTVTVEEMGDSSSKWYVYTYEIDPAVFQENDALKDGRYSILFYGVDEAGNTNTNESNEFGAIQLGADGEYSGKIEFSLDTQKPVISIVGIEAGRTYNVDHQTARITISDNSPVGVEIYLNGNLVPMAESIEGNDNSTAWAAYDPATGEYVLNIPSANDFGAQDLRVIAKDEAGNNGEATVDGFRVTTSIWVRLLTSPGFYICLGLILLVLILLLLMKKKKSEDKNAGQKA